MTPNDVAWGYCTSCRGVTLGLAAVVYEEGCEATVTTGEGFVANVVDEEGGWGFLYRLKRSLCLPSG